MNPIINGYNLDHENRPIRGTVVWCRIPEGYSDKIIKSTYVKGSNVKIGLTSSSFYSKKHTSSNEEKGLVQYLSTHEEVEAWEQEQKRLEEERKKIFVPVTSYGKAELFCNENKQAKIILMDAKWEYSLDNSLDYMNFLQKCDLLKLPLTEQFFKKYVL